MEQQQWQELAGEVAPLLGPGWTVEPPGTHVGAMLTGPHGEQLQVRYNPEGDPTRVYVAGRYPQHDLGPQKTHRLTISRAAASPTAIARAITRRLLDTYRTDLARVLEYNRHQDRNRQQREHAAAKLAALLDGSTTDENYQNRHGTRVHWYAPTGAVGVPVEITAELNADGSSVYTLELRSVPLGLAGLLLDLANTPETSDD